MPTTKFDPVRPYNGLPLLPPACDIETKAILKKCVTAQGILGNLKDAAALIPNPDVLINTIPLLEAKDSSAIENIVTTSDALFRFANDTSEPADAATKETLRYRTALLEGCRDIQTRPISTRTATKICRTIKGTDLDIRRTPGTVLRNEFDRATIYTPPEGEAVIREKLANWERFLHEHDEIEPLVRLAVAHYQFEAIHPYPDGNGRTGRILNILFLIEHKLLDLPILYLSRYINDHRAEYYELLRGVTERGAWEPWILYMLTAIDETARWTHAKVRAIKRLMDEATQFVSANHPKIYSLELIELLFTQPYCRTGNLVRQGFGNRNTATKHLKELSHGNVVTYRKAGREALYINGKFLDLLMSDDNTILPYRR